MNDDAIARFTDEDGDDNALPAEFATATMGHVLLGQGRLAEARAVFAAVLTRDPADAEARRGIDVIDGPVSLPPEPAYVRCLAVDPTTLMVHWSAPAASLAHLTARPAEAQLAVMITSLRAGPVGILTAHRTLTLASRSGEIAVRGLEPGAVHHVALGARIHDRFVSFARAGGTATPSDGPQPVLDALPLTAPLARAAEAPRSAVPDATSPDAASPFAGSPLAFAPAQQRWAQGLASS